MSTTYVAGSACSAYGHIDDTSDVVWTGAISANTTITATFAVTISAGISEPTVIVNAAMVQAEQVQPFTVTVPVIVNARRAYLPLVLRAQ